MAYKLKILAHYDLSLFAYSGKVTPADFDGVWRDLAALKDYHPDIDGLIVLGPDADYSDFAHQMASGEAEKFALEQAGDRPKKVKHTAVVCATQMQVVVTRMFAAYLMSYWPSLVEVACFRDLDAAIDWLEPANGDGRRIDRDEIKRQFRELGQGWCCGEDAA